MRETETKKMIALKAVGSEIKCKWINTVLIMELIGLKPKPMYMLLISETF